MTALCDFCATDRQPEESRVTYVFLDCETTGLDPERHEVWEIAYAVDDGPVLSAIVSHLGTGADPKALAMNGYWQRSVFEQSFNPHMWELDLRAAVAGATLVAANPAFDTSFLRARWGEAPWKYRLLDVETYAMPALGLAEPKGLAYIAEQLGVTAPDHSAAADVHTLRECWRALRTRYATEETK